MQSSCLFVIDLTPLLEQNNMLVLLVLVFAVFFLAGTHLQKWMEISSSETEIIQQCEGLCVMWRKQFGCQLTGIVWHSCYRQQNVSLEYRLEIHPSDYELTDYHVRSGLLKYKRQTCKNFCFPVFQESLHVTLCWHFTKKHSHLWALKLLISSVKIWAVLVMLS